MPIHGIVGLGLIILYLPLPSHQHLYSLHMWDASEGVEGTTETQRTQRLIASIVS